MTDYSRFAVFHVPRKGPLSEFSACLLGWDAETGVFTTAPEIGATQVTLHQLTLAARKYGFHATIMPPFRPSRALSELEADIEALARSLPALEIADLTVQRFGRFLALAPRTPTPEVKDVAARVVAGLDHHRAPMTEQEKDRRLAGTLTDRQRKNVDEWGYAHVLEDYRFHMTLTGRLPKRDIRELAPLLEQALGPLIPRPYVIEDLCLVGEAPDGMFHLIRRFEMAGPV